jgi:hypothetical protein
MHLTLSNLQSLITPSLLLGTLACLAPVGALADSPMPPHAPIPVRFHLAAPGYVTLVIDDPAGHRVRNLISETLFPAGDDTAWWDGLDDVGRIQTAANYNFKIDGKLVSAGKYEVRGLVRPAIQLQYEATAYNPGSPPWDTSDPSSDWLANHTPPSGVLFLPKALAGQTPVPPTTDGEMLVCSAVTEGGSGLAWIDLNGKKLRGQTWVGGVWTGATNMAADAGDDPVQGVYAYTGSAWAGGGYDGAKPELRLAELLDQGSTVSAPRDGRLGTGVDRPLLAPNDPYPGLLPQGQNSLKAADEDYRYTFPDNDHVGLSGLAVRNGILVASLPKMDQLLFVDARARKILGSAPLSDPHGVAFDAAGHLLALSGKTLVRFASATSPTALPAPQTIVADGLDDPQNLTLDAQGNIYISDWGDSNQVKVFSPDGHPLRTIGDPGLPRLGPYDPQLMHHPNGLAIDSQGRLWVAETDYEPKRVSVWTTSGAFVKAFYGPMEYGGGGSLDPEDPSRYYYSGMQLKVDWTTGQTEPQSIYYMPSADKLALPGEFKGRAPETLINYGGHQYLTDCYNVSPTTGAQCASLWLLKGGVARPVAAAGDASAWKNQALPAHDPNSYFLWTDINGDGQVEPNEVTFFKGKGGGVTVMPHLSFVLAYAGDNAVRFTPSRITADGVPVYDPTPVTLATGARAPQTTGGGQALVGSEGWTILTVPPAPFAIQGSMAGVKDGQPMWTYPSLWPGLHPSHDAPMPDHPGELIGTTRLLGGLFTPNGSDSGPMWAINGNKGNVYIFTQDGLFVATLFQDCRTQSWSAPRAVRGMSVSNLSLNEEDFWPTLTQTMDGSIYIVGGGSGGNIIQVKGLEQVRRLPSAPLDVSAGQIDACRDYAVQQEAAAQSTAPKTLSIPVRPVAPSLDANLSNWASAHFVPIDSDTSAALAISGDHLYAAFKTTRPDLIVNSASSPQMLFKTGGALDIMVDGALGPVRLLVAQAKGQPIAMLYRLHATSGANPVAFSSPQRTIKFDRVDDVSSSVTLTSSGGNYEVSAPLSLLGMTATPGVSLTGDIGILRGDGFQTLYRAYWSNKATGLTSDVPSEAELLPQLWGAFQIGASQ